MDQSQQGLENPSELSEEAAAMRTDIDSAQAARLMAEKPEVEVLREYVQPELEFKALITKFWSLSNLTFEDRRRLYGMIRVWQHWNKIDAPLLSQNVRERIESYITLSRSIGGFERQAENKQEIRLTRTNEPKPTPQPSIGILSGK